MKTALIIAWRQGETELQETIDSAKKSLPQTAEIYPVEDKSFDGPGKTRNRGIEAAVNADVCIIVDPHMRFKGKVLARMAKEVYKNSGLLCPRCHHNRECSFDTLGDKGQLFYAGADIEWMGHDANGPASLVWKWSKEKNTGKRACIGGACYAFRRDWYFDVGQPLAALTGWGGDEEALSISAWLSGFDPMIFDGDVAHRYRDSAPWGSSLTAKEVSAIKYESRGALISAVAADWKDKRDLLGWQRSREITTPEVIRWHDCLKKQKRTWSQWKEEVPIMARKKQVEEKKPIEKKPRANYGSAENNRVCRKCGSAASSVESVRKTGRMTVRYRICSACGTRRTTQEISCAIATP